MAHITLDETLPGIRGLMAFRPETAKPLNELAEALLRADNSLSRGDRELIATYVSSLNDCFFCQNAHGGLAQHYLQCDMTFIDGVKQNADGSPISDKLKALEDEQTPRARTWDPLVQQSGVPGIHFEDYPELASFQCPEWSHLSAGDSVEFTKRLVPHLRTALGL